MAPEAGGPADSELADRARRGDVDAFTILVRRYEATALRIAALICGSANAPDAVQEAFVRAYRSLDRYDPTREFRPWFLRILTNVAKNSVRTERRRLDVALRVPVADATEDHHAVEGEQERAAVLRALLELPERDRVILACRWFEEMSEREIADALDCKPGTVKSRLSRAMDRLRAQLSTEVVHD